MSKLKAVSPEAKEKRFKAIIAGTYGVGKTPSVLQFPNSVVIDTEKGTDPYTDLINSKNSVVLQSSNFEEIKQEILTLLTDKHDFTTFIIDPETHVYASCIEKWKKVFEKYETSEKNKELEDYGVRFWGKVNSDFHSLQRLYLKLDMNVIVTTHLKPEMKNNAYIGNTYDTIRNAAHLFDFCFKIEKRNGVPWAITDRERALKDKAKFPEAFEWSYENFIKYYGKENLERKSAPIEMASKEDVEKINLLLKNIIIEPDVIAKWMTKADADSFDEFTKEQITKCIDFLEKKVELVK